MPKKPTAANVPGYGKRGGAARKAGKAVEKRKRRNRSALDIARGTMKPKKKQ